MVSVKENDGAWKKGKKESEKERKAHTSQEPKSLLINPINPIKHKGKEGREINKSMRHP